MKSNEESEKHIPTVVLAACYKDFVNWCRESGINPQNRDYVYAINEFSIRGLHEFHLIRLDRYSVSRAWKLYEYLGALKDSGCILSDVDLTPL